MFFRPSRVYMDYASATPVHPAALQAMREADARYGNPGAIHREGVEARQVLEISRERVAAQLSVKPREIVFTSGLTESNNLAILGFARAMGRSGRDMHGTHFVASAIEHDSVLEVLCEVERQGGRVTLVRPDVRGIVTPEKIANALLPETVCVSVGWANNEIGTVQPIARIAEALRAHETANGGLVLLHADAGQAPLYRATTAHSLGVDLLSVGANKLYGPHGIGALYLGNRASLAGHILGGRQERGIRAGTESVALAAGFAAAYEAVAEEREGEGARLRDLRDTLARELARTIPGLVINGSLEHALPHMLNVSIPRIQGEYVALALDARGIAVSTKSACREGEEPESHVVAALVPREASHEDGWRATNSLRISLGRGTKKDDIRRLVRELAAVVALPR